ASGRARLTPVGSARGRPALADRLQLVAARTGGEVAAAPVEGAVHLPLARLRERLGELDPSAPVVLVCAGGTRSAIASSVLRAEGFADVSDLLGGAAALGV